ncbi:farnesyl pyrophosphate synthase 1-like [Pogonomyrmex barbatus]|uniref:Farnesyl pyrophosphate synthase 1-like n=1 Tax=Pogonomyrmex barbatus TaxID=144034 RepID=A0A8N1S8K5_9HYME|nr:farnesyl pyrophosphate synthase 1-like [Pogonomyrmex barbatus]
MFVTRNRFLSTLGAARRLTVSADHVHVASMGVRRACSPVYRGNACWRLLDHNHVRMTHSVTQPWITTEDENREMMALWPEVVSDLVHGAKISMPYDLPDLPNVHKWMAKILQYIVPGEKKTRGLTVPYVYRLLTSNDQLTEDNIRLTRILEFCVEMLQAYSFLLEDLQDGYYMKLLHKDLPYWYRIYDELSQAIAEDGIILEYSFYYVIQKHFEGKECCTELLVTFQDILWKTINNQWIDLESTDLGMKLNHDLFTMDRYNSIVEYKTSHYSFLLPVIAAMHFAGIKDPEMFKQAELILLGMGRFFQVRDDYMACFEESEVVGKYNTDIQKGKCTWLIVTALDRATPVQRNILKECYGSSDPEKVKRVKQLFIDLELPDRYSIYEDETYNLLNELLQQISPGPLHSFFSDLLGKLYRRGI